MIGHNDPHISTHHFEICLLENNFYIKDLQSTNGIWTRLSPSGIKSAFYQLFHDDVLRIAQSYMYQAQRSEISKEIDDD